MTDRIYDAGSTSGGLAGARHVTAFGTMEKLRFAVWRDGWRSPSSAVLTANEVWCFILNRLKRLRIVFLPTGEVVLEDTVRSAPYQLQGRDVLCL